jgi:stage V sporulation protein SpoVS
MRSSALRWLVNELIIISVRTVEYIDIREVGENDKPSRRIPSRLRINTADYNVGRQMMSSVNNPSNSGGAATQAGINYQNQVAAWICTRILAEREATPLWRFPEGVTFEFIRCETEQPVDDLLVGTSAGGHAFIQVKHTVTSSRASDSALASALDQFVRQFISYRTGVAGKQRWERPLDESLDRLVLVTSSKSSVSVREHLPALLTRLRTIAPSQGIDAAAINQDERKTLAVLRGHLARIWDGCAGTAISEAEEHQLLNLIWVQVLDVEEEGLNEREAKDLLRSSIINDPSQADAAW